MQADSGRWCSVIVRDSVSVSEESSAVGVHWKGCKERVLHSSLLLLIHSVIAVDGRVTVEKNTATSFPFRIESIFKNPPPLIPLLLDLLALLFTDEQEDNVAREIGCSNQPEHLLLLLSILH